MPPKLQLSVQYATNASELTRWRLRRWVQRALNAGAQDLHSTAAPPLTRAELTLRLVDIDEGLTLNRSYRGRDYATNVLTFAYGTDPDGAVSGDIVLCVPVLYREALEQGKPLLHHAAHLTMHGVLHALGYDHVSPDQAAHMEHLEICLLAALNIPNPYQAAAT